MAAGDVYKLTYNVAQEGVVMVAELDYVQVAEPQSGDHGAFHLAQSFYAAADGIADSLATLMGEKAFMPCCKAKKIIDTSGTGHEEEILFDENRNGNWEGTMPAHTTAVLTLSDQRVSLNDPKVRWRGWYLGGIAENYVDGPHFKVGFSTALDLVVHNFFSPNQDAGTVEIWRLVIEKNNAYRNCVLIDVPIFVSNRKGRKQRLCNL